MKKDKKNGFTLIELLAVVVILLAISVIAISSISAAVERNKAKQNEAKKAVLESYGKLYYDSHRNTFTDSSGCIQVDLIFDEFDLTEDEQVDADGETFAGFIKVDNGKTFTYVEGNCP